jgi:hypothetical protein
MLKYLSTLSVWSTNCQFAEDLFDEFCLENLNLSSSWQYFQTNSGSHFEQMVNLVETHISLLFVRYLAFGSKFPTFTEPKAREG